ncbi:hypothetical protein LOC67_17885 [Stieleria sp. JC731]|uniref:hypothetical protein n=1 Tax=Pirellulaceae TaxID=2691357 RepID=UPI001E4D3699|nr:hypothetical protein [Stieleria sp. JC731]MCC9602424.1 hypothetical protein [Stieleria sp. JC731]
MKKVLCNLLGISTVALALVSTGCQPPKPPAPETEEVASDNTTANTTAAAETPAVETPEAEEAAE